MNYLKFLVGWVFLLLQYTLVAVNSTWDTWIESTIFGWSDSLPIFLPLLITVVYALITKDTVLTAMIGLLSWLCQPVAAAVFFEDYPSLGYAFTLLTYGLLYALIGFVAAKLRLWISWDKSGGGGGFGRRRG